MSLKLLCRSEGESESQSNLTTCETRAAGLLVLTGHLYTALLSCSTVQDKRLKNCLYSHALKSKNVNRAVQPCSLYNLHCDLHCDGSEMVGVGLVWVGVARGVEEGSRACDSGEGVGLHTCSPRDRPSPAPTNRGGFRKLFA